MKTKKAKLDPGAPQISREVRKVFCAFSRNDGRGVCAIAIRRMQQISRAARPGLSSLICLAAIFLQLSTLATGSVTLIWNPSLDPIVAGYKIHYGGASGVYTNQIDVGNATNATIAGLIEGATYYFTATTYTAAGAESPRSGELIYAVPLRAILIMQAVRANGVLAAFSIIANGSIPNHWALQSSSDLRSWAIIAQGSNLAVNVLVPVNGQSMQFFRLISQ